MGNKKMYSYFCEEVILTCLKEQFPSSIFMLLMRFTGM